MAMSEEDGLACQAQWMNKIPRANVQTYVCKYMLRLELQGKFHGYTCIYMCIYIYVYTDV